MKRRGFLAAGGAALLWACAAVPRGTFDATEVPAPRWRAGDNWTFRRTDGYNGLPRGVLTRTVESLEPLRLVTRTEAGIVLDDALFQSPGIQMSGSPSEYGPMWGTFAPYLHVYEFPLVSGKRWRQSFSRTDANGTRGFATASTSVEGWEEAGALDKTYRALVIRRSFMLWPTVPYFYGVLNREELEWYAPELRGTIRMRVLEYIAGRRRMYWIPGDRFVYALESFRLA